jgi:FAD/FMN-containing dehydrogenase
MTGSGYRPIMNRAANLAAYENKKLLLITSLQQQPGTNIRLIKDTSNLFRERKPLYGHGLNVRDFNKVIYVDPEEGFAEVEGMTVYADLAGECLKHGVMPSVVPQLKSITIGGAVSGIGIESSSFKYGLVHETVEEMDILLGDGTTLTCTPENDHQRLFFGFPNSYGTLGYALKLKIKVVPVKPYVRLRHIRHVDAAAYFADLEYHCKQDIDFIDGTIFGPDEYYLTVGEFSESAPYTSDYTYKNIYYRSIRERESDYLKVEDYIWRWDTDWFWCSQYIFAHKPLIRRLLGPNRLNSVTYTKIMRWNRKYNIAHYLDRLLGFYSEAVIQDVEIPLERCAEFMDFYFSSIKFTPVWACPIRPLANNARFPLYPLDPATLYVNFGFWNVIKNREKMAPGHYNRLVEKKVSELGGMKSLYSDAYYSPEQFWRIFNKDEYFSLKNRYDPKGHFKDLYAKCVQHA